jgi:hypothetical protein
MAAASTKLPPPPLLWAAATVAAAAHSEPAGARPARPCLRRRRLRRRGAHPEPAGARPRPGLRRRRLAAAAHPEPAGPAPARPSSSPPPRRTRSRLGPGPALPSSSLPPPPRRTRSRPARSRRPWLHPSLSTRFNMIILNRVPWLLAAPAAVLNVSRRDDFDRLTNEIGSACSTSTCSNQGRSTCPG